MLLIRCSYNVSTVRTQEPLSTTSSSLVKVTNNFAYTVLAVEATLPSTASRSRRYFGEGFYVEHHVAHSHLKP